MMPRWRSRRPIRDTEQSQRGAGGAWPVSRRRWKAASARSPCARIMPTRFTIGAMSCLDLAGSTRRTRVSRQRLSSSRGASMPATILGWRCSLSNGRQRRSNISTARSRSTPTSGALHNRANALADLARSRLRSPPASTLIAKNPAACRRPQYPWRRPRQARPPCRGSGELRRGADGRARSHRRSGQSRHGSARARSFRRSARELRQGARARSRQCRRPDQSRQRAAQGPALRRGSCKLRRALVIKPDQADRANDRGIVLAEINHFDEALACYEQALRIEPRSGRRPRQSRQRACRSRMEEALRVMKQAVALEPDNTDAQFQRLAHAPLHRRFPRGWKQYEYRWKKKGSVGAARRLFAADLGRQ